MTDASICQNRIAWIMIHPEDAGSRALLTARQGAPPEQLVSQRATMGRSAAAAEMVMRGRMHDEAWPGPVTGGVATECLELLD